MQKWTVGILALVMTILIGCATPTRTAYQSYEKNGVVVELGMSSAQVKEALGAPKDIVVPYRVGTQQFWCYGDCGGVRYGEQLMVMMENSVVVGIDHFRW